MALPVPPPNPRPLPKLAELHHDIDAAFRNDQLNLLLNQPPHDSWVRKAHSSMGGGGYLPIARVEDLMTRIFQEWRVEIKSVTPAFNAMLALVRLHYKNPITGEWSYHDGCGAKSLQLNAGTAASDLTAVKDAAVMLAGPSAVSFAIKDAAEHLGRLFGRDLNRKDAVQFTGSYDRPETPAQNAPQHIDAPHTDDVPVIQVDRQPVAKQAPPANPLTNPAPTASNDFEL